MSSISANMSDMDFNEYLNKIQTLTQEQAREVLNEAKKKLSESMVYVARLPKGVTNGELQALFLHIDRELRVKSNDKYAIIHFSEVKYASKALEEFNGFKWKGTELIVVPFDRTKRDRKKVIIANVSSESSANSIMEAFREYEPNNVKIFDHTAYIYVEQSVLKKVIDEMDGTDLDGSRINVYPGRPKHHKTDAPSQHTRRYETYDDGFRQRRMEDDRNRRRRQETDSDGFRRQRNYYKR